MSLTSYGSKSPYYLTPVREFYLDIYVDRPIDPSMDDVLIEVESKHENRPDMLSYDLYGTAKYWWIFIRRNRDRMEDPIYDLKPGLEIYVPTKERLLNLIG